MFVEEEKLKGFFKDPSALFLADPTRFPENWRSVREKAIPFVDIENSERSQAADVAYTLAKDLLHDSRLLERIGEVMREHGYAGNLNPPKLGYIAFTSRLLERPQNLAFVSPSAAGKSRTLEAPSELMPEDAYFLEKSGSARALVYNDASYEHKVLVVAEADSIPEDGPAAAAIRSIAADNSMEYDIVERNETTGKFETRRIVKPGPTGLITTSTRSLKTQMGTRVLEIAVADDADQTRDVMRAHARSVQPGTMEQTDLRPFIAVQQ